MEGHAAASASPLARAVAAGRQGAGLQLPASESAIELLLFNSTYKLNTMKFISICANIHYYKMKNKKV